MALLTQRAIISAFEEMLEEMPFDRITVTALVKRAGVSANSFYYHYQDIYALLDFWFGQLTKEISVKVLSKEDPHWGDCIKAVLEKCISNPRKLKHIIESLSRERFERYVFSQTNDFVYRLVKARTEDKNLSEEQVEYISEFCRYSIVGFLLKFIWDDMVDDIDECSARMGRMFDAFVENAERNI